MKRDNIIENLDRSWDLIIVGGGIIGAGVFREASQSGLKCLLLEQRDFAWGTSSRSGKLVHGGLRYLSQGQLKTTYHSVRERQKMLSIYPGLVQPLDFLIPLKAGDAKTPWVYKIGLTLYDLMAGRKSHQHYSQDAFLAQIPDIGGEGLNGGFRYQDALTDDARLVLQIIQEGIAAGGIALNYCSVEELLKQSDGTVRGVRVHEVVADQRLELTAQVVINATGAWSDHLRKAVGKSPKIRRLRGSHLIVPRAKLPLTSAVAFTHPADKRPLYILPWKQHILIGTTDLDHGGDLNTEPRISRAEGQYFFEAIADWFPSVQLSSQDIISTFAGVRPVVDTGKKDPSKESREHVVWRDKGMITVAGGKLTTFRLLAQDVLKEVAKLLQKSPNRQHQKPKENFDLLGQYADADDNLMGSRELILKELARSAAHEWVVHLDDLLLRRTRVGLLTPDGGIPHLDEIKSAIVPVLNWNDARWEQEKKRYVEIWQQAYSPQLVM